MGAVNPFLLQRPFGSDDLDENLNQAIIGPSVTAQSLTFYSSSFRLVYWLLCVMNVLSTANRSVGVKFLL
jgi:hypothetical protein